MRILECLILILLVINTIIFTGVLLELGAISEKILTTKLCINRDSKTIIDLLDKLVNKQ